LEGRYILVLACHSRSLIGRQVQCCTNQEDTPWWQVPSVPAVQGRFLLGRPVHPALSDQGGNFLGRPVQSALASWGGNLLGRPVQSAPVGPWGIVLRWLVQSVPVHQRQLVLGGPVGSNPLARGCWFTIESETPPRHLIGVGWGLHGQAP
jgi:hypothetical protein